MRLSEWVITRTSTPQVRVLIRFKIYQIYIEQLNSFNLDPIDCEMDPCHLAWLIRDNRHLLSAIGGQCSNGTLFDYLDPNAFTDFPVIIIVSYFDLNVIQYFKITSSTLHSATEQSFVCVR